MKTKIKKPVFFITFFVILAFALSTVFGIASYKGDIKTTYVHGLEDIRLGIDIQGGVDVTFEPEDNENATEEQMDAALQVIKLRLTNLGINDSETYVDYNNSRIIVRFPWQSGEENFDPAAAVNELGQMSELTFRYGTDLTGDLILSGADVSSASPGYDQQNDQWVVQLQLNDSGKEAFATATTEQASSNGYISIWMDDTCISSATVNEAITNGQAVISGNFTSESAKELADQITSGALPFSLHSTSTKTLSPTLGSGALYAMILSGLIALGFICIYMLVLYRVPGFIAVIGLIGQVAGMLAAVSGWFGFLPSSTLTIPGIAGIILSVGMGVDCNIITAERIKEELSKGKSLDSSLKAGYANAFSAILDGNLTLAIVAVILMGAFGTNTNFLTKILDATIFYFFGATTEGFIYSFGFTLIMGVILNFIMGVALARLMTFSLARFKAFQKPALYGYVKDKYKEAKTRKFSENKKKFFIISACLVLVSICTTFLGVEVAIDFKGGTIVSYSYHGDLEETACQSEIESILNTPVTLQKGESFDADTNILTVSFSYDESLTLDQQENMLQVMQETYPDNNIEELESNDVSPSSGREFFAKCIVAVIFAGILLIIYIALRFKKISGWSAGVFTIITLLHDIIITYGSFVLCGFEIDSNFMAVILTIFGYSINNTIIVYDRIRENQQKLSKNTSIAELVNLSASQTLRRSLRTSVTTVVTMIIISIVAYIFNVSSILSFSVPMTFGLIAGTYSSQCIAPTLWVWWNERHGNQQISDVAVK
ncbi:MAG: protein translocase subunit SecF [Oscillospiraceae bacterium]|nr:protein translocase subunit SecF [Ruminococcus sp.]MDE6707207.1 protein translocase subunit SecF [Oscillospiraceae bacterium]